MLFPAKEIFIRFQCVPTPENENREKAVTFEFVGYEYEAKLAKELPEFEGKTEFVETSR